jgi:rhombotail lipoprotein
MALVSYDQIATTTDTNASFLYWTIVGAYTKTVHSLKLAL